MNKIAVKARNQSLNKIFDVIAHSLSNNGKRELNRLLLDKTDDGYSLWNKVKLEPKKPGPREIRAFIQHTHWLTNIQHSIGKVPEVPEQIRIQCILEARAYSADRMRRTRKNKRLSLMAILINEQRLYANDCLVDMFIREIRKVHQVARKAQQLYQTRSSSESASLVNLLYEIALTCSEEKSNKATENRIYELMGDDPKAIAGRCKKLVDGGIDNYLFFLDVRYNSKTRRLLLNILSTIEVRSIARNSPVRACLNFLMAHSEEKFYTIKVKALSEHSNLHIYTLLYWIPRSWYKLIFKDDQAHLKNRQLVPLWFELCVMTEVSKLLRSGDIYIKNSIKYDDYRTHLVDQKTYKDALPAYCEQAGLPESATEFVNSVKQTFLKSAAELDVRFDAGDAVLFENGRIVLKRPAKSALPHGFEKVYHAIKKQIPEINIIDLLVDAIKWVDLKPFFRPLSGNKSRISSVERRLVATLFCYGCNIGPTQTARCIDGFTRKQIAYINLSQTSEQNLVDATEQVINAYNKYELPDYWGSGNTASVDGTRFDMYEQNMLSEYHVRYASYGGVGYYLVSDKYIALFSRFIPCGVREAIHLIDGLMENTSDIQPNSIHGDTHAQSTVVFGLAHLLGIKLMPRIKDINSLIFFKPDKRISYKHIDELFTDSINFSQIRDNHLEMLRIAVSIKMGKVSASTIVRRLGTEGIRNNLFYAFRELGRVVRTTYLLEYIGSIDLRKTVNAATCKSEEFNNFLKSVFFYNNGIIQQNLRHEQAKIVKFNHLVANLIILHNVNSLTKEIRKLQSMGYEITPEILAGFSPFGMSHINLLGLFELNTSRRPVSVKYHLSR